MAIATMYGPELMTLTSQHENEKAWQWYKRAGFTIVGQQVRAAHVQRGQEVAAMPEYIMQCYMKQQLVYGSSTPTERRDIETCAHSSYSHTIPPILQDAAMSELRLLGCQPA